MKNALSFLGALMLVALQAFSAVLLQTGFVFADPGMGGSGGGPRVGQMVTVKVCDSGESGMACRTVSYRVLGQNQPVADAKCLVAGGEAGEVPCPEKYGVPAWLKRLNESFGARTIHAETDYVGGP